MIGQHKEELVGTWATHITCWAILVRPLCTMKRYVHDYPICEIGTGILQIGRAFENTFNLILIFIPSCTWLDDVVVLWKAWHGPD